MINFPLLYFAHDDQQLFFVTKIFGNKFNNQIGDWVRWVLLLSVLMFNI